MNNGMAGEKDLASSDLVEPTKPTMTDDSRGGGAMELNAAYECMEQMRKLNVEIQCEELGISPVHDDICVTCLLSGEQSPQTRRQLRTQNNSNKPVAQQNNDAGGSQRPPQRQGQPLHRKQRVSSRVQNVLRRSKEKLSRHQGILPQPCLICGNPVCARHASKLFAADGDGHRTRNMPKITLCSDCERLFQTQFVVDCLQATTARERQQRVDYLLQLYDRCLLILRYAANENVLDQTAAQLENKKARQNKRGVGGSTAGVVSGALGIAAAVTIWTPVGPPLLIASVLCGTSAQAVRSSTELNNRFFSDSHKVADNIIALHGMLQNILQVADAMRDVVTRDLVWTECSLMPEDRLVVAAPTSSVATASMELQKTLQSAALSCCDNSSAIVTSQRNSRIVIPHRFLRSMHPYAYMAGQAISATRLLLEAKSMHDTTRAIYNGNPCDKANALRRIRQSLECLPSAPDLELQCELYLNSSRSMTEDEAIRLLTEISQRRRESETQAKRRGVLVATNTDDDRDGRSPEIRLQSLSSPL